MIANLRFDRAGRPRFEPSTNLRLATVCAVANNVTEHLARLLDRPIAIDVFEPVCVPLGAQPALFADAHVFLAHARRSDLLVVLRARDARRLIASAFRVEAQTLGQREFSAVEEDVLERIAHEVARLCAPVVGEVGTFARAAGCIDAYACATYFELRLAAPVDAVIGLGLARDPAAPSEARVVPAALSSVPLTLRARLGKTRVAARALVGYSVGTIVAFDAPLTQPATLLAGDVVIAHGECGVRDGKVAFAVTAAAKPQGAAS